MTGGVYISPTGKPSIPQGNDIHICCLTVNADDISGWMFSCQMVLRLVGRSVSKKWFRMTNIATHSKKKKTLERNSLSSTKVEINAHTQIEEKHVDRHTGIFKVAQACVCPSD